MKYDILVVGSGIAGMMAALRAKELGGDVAIVMKKSPLANNSFMAKGGINAALNNMGDGDSVEHHIEDTLAAGKGLAEEEVVRVFCENAPKVVMELYEKYKVPFTTLPDGRLAQRPFGGTKYKRTVYAADATGPAIMKALNEALSKSGVKVLKNLFALNLITDDNRIIGISFLDKNDEVKVILAKSVIMATGGFAALYRGRTTNVNDALGDGVAMGLRAGMEVMDMEFVQFHPTGLEGTTFLISEAARGEGGKLISSNGEEFVDELATRDFVTRAIVKEMQEGRKVYLDLTHLDEEIINTKLINIKKRVKSLKGIDISKEPIPINPLAHYTIGGIKTDVAGRTSIEGLFYVGEAANNGVNGANRLGGNSLSEGAVFGEIAAQEAVEYVKTKGFGKITDEILKRENSFVNKIKELKVDSKLVKEELGNTLFLNAGIVRSKESLTSSKEVINSLKERFFKGDFENDSSLREKIECLNAFDVAQVLVDSALEREESRGVHFREDFPEMKEEFTRHTLKKLN